MKKDYVVLYITVDGKYYRHFNISSISFVNAYKSAKSFGKKSNLTLIGLVERQALENNSQIFNI